MLLICRAGRKGEKAGRYDIRIRRAKGNMPLVEAKP